MGHKASGNYPTLSLEEYVFLLSEVRRPTDEQIDNFVWFVATGHSWYKRIPYLLPGVPFHFFIDPFAGSNFSVTWTGKVKITPRIGQGFHYSWIPTQAYREQFGHLAYSCEAAGQFTDVRWLGRIRSTDCSPAILGRNGKLAALPTEVLEAGTVSLTAVIHTHIIHVEILDIVLSKKRDQENSWAAESGGQETLQRIVVRCRELLESRRTDQSRIAELEQAALEEAMQLLRARHQETRDLKLTDATRIAELNRAARLEYRQLLSEKGVRFVVSDDDELLFIDPELYALVVPEQRRQRKEMAKAIKRVCELLWGK